MSKIGWKGPAELWGLTLEEFTVTETLAEGYQCVLRFAAPGERPLPLEAARQALLGQRLAFGLGERRWHGVVTRVSTDPVRREVTVEVRPRLALLANATDCRVFLDRTAVEVVTEVCEAMGVPLGPPRLQDPTHRYPVCVEYRESHLRFVRRLAEEQGLTFVFVQTDDGEQAVLTDQPAAVFPAVERVAWRPRKPLQGHPGVHSWAGDSVAVAGEMALNAWHWQTPRVNLLVQDEVPGRAAGDGGQVYDLGQYPDEAEGRRQLQIRGEEEAARRDTFHGSSDVTALAAGMRFQFDAVAGTDRLPVASPADTFLVVRVTHRAVRGAGADHAWYDNTFDAIPATARYRPARHTPRPMIAGYALATVVTASGKDDGEGREVVHDALGRVYLRFPWQHGPNRELAVPARVGQVWAGPGWGAWFVPRLGQEVLVCFEEGDPDLPVVVGCVYHRPEDMPADPSKAPTRTGLFSRSTPGGRGGSQVSFEDEKGREQLTIVAERDQTTLVKHDQQTSIGGSRLEHIRGDQEVTVDGKHRQKVKELIVSADVIHLLGKKVLIAGEEVGILSSGQAYLNGSVVHLNGSGAPQAPGGVQPRQPEPPAAG
jgi:type VI secretion system secreted protein VgrG